MQCTLITVVCAEDQASSIFIFIAMDLERASDFTEAQLLRMLGCPGAGVLKLRAVCKKLGCSCRGNRHQILVRLQEECKKQLALQGRIQFSDANKKGKKKKRRGG